MPNRLLHLMVITVVAGAAVVVLAVAIGSAAPSTSLSGREAHTDAPVVEGRVAARRAISIPYGISSVLTLTADGSQLQVTGHAVCWEEGQMFDLQVRVAQSTTQAFALGRSVDICAGGERQIWDAQAETGSQAHFEAGPARACAEALELAVHGTADEYWWCKDVEVVPAIAEE